MKESNAYCDSVFNALTDADGDDGYRGRGPRRSSRFSRVASSSLAECYGMAPYLRLKGTCRRRVIATNGSHPPLGSDSGRWASATRRSSIPGAGSSRPRPRLVSSTSTASLRFPQLLSLSFHSPIRGPHARVTVRRVRTRGFESRSSRRVIDVDGLLGDDLEEVPTEPISAKGRSPAPLQ